MATMIDDEARERIYIPIWLDLLFDLLHNFRFRLFYLHSNMVRFIMNSILKTVQHLKKIYIPIWLDLLSYPRVDELLYLYHLHSNMVRFIMLSEYS